MAREEMRSHTQASKVLDVDYYEERDILYLRVLPPRSARLREVAEDFYVCVDWEDGQTVVGFEVHYLSLWDVEGAAAEKELEPYLHLCFDLPSGKLQGVSLSQVLRWAQRKYVAKTTWETTIQQLADSVRELNERVRALEQRLPELTPATH